jgi:hypothetical protein
MSECEICKDLNEEKEQVAISVVKIAGWYYHWGCDIMYCPACGKKITHKTEGEDKE